MPKKLTALEFIEKAAIIHNDKYDYSKVLYVNAQSKVEIICPEHGSFFQRPYSHLQKIGCIKCSGKHTSNTNEFIKKSTLIHNNKYTYSKTEYTKAKNKVIITCPKHGDFFQISSAHLEGCGCTKCGRENTKLSLITNPNGWTNTAWQNASEKSKNFDGFKVYVVKVKIKSTGEKFWKIGKTYMDIKKRFGMTNLSIYPILEIPCSSAKEATELEAKLKRLPGNIKYLPNTKFAGMYECFSVIDKAPLLKFKN
jgi:hypothetical protein